MPFNIAYTGPAPVNTYFRPVRSKREDDIEGPKDEKTLPQNLSSDSQSTLVASSSSEQLTTSETQNTLAADVDMLTLSEQTTPSMESGSQDTKQLTAAFRGRTLRSSEIELPTGYVGLVLDAPVISATVRRRAPADDRSDAIEDHEENEDSRPTKHLHPKSQFRSFTLWNADIPVDEGRDEYLRSLREWVNLAAVVGVSSFLQCRMC